MSYGTFKDEDGEDFGSFEVFHWSEAQAKEYPGECFDGEPLGAGWYWWACFPGCLPDGDPTGPFATEEEAIADAEQAS